MPYILASDIGATHSRFAVFSVTASVTGLPKLRLQREVWLPTAQYPSFAALLHSLPPQADGAPFVPEKTVLASLGVAGPITGENCQPPGIAWQVEAATARTVLGIPQVLLINDFVAQGYACLLACLDTTQTKTLDIKPLEKNTARTAPIAIVGAGSGCGMALVLPERCLVLPSEGGHTDFAFLAEEYEFSQFVQKQRGSLQITTDHIASGSGLAHLFAYHTGERLSPKEVALRLTKPQTAQEHTALEWFARFYGRACRNFVLSSLALGGLYITGGMAMRVPVLQNPVFLSSFHSGGAHTALLKKIPIWHIRNQQAGLWGAALYGGLQQT